jgi:hypothetical protein
MLHRRVVVLAVAMLSACALVVPTAGAQATNPVPYALKTRIPVPTWAGTDSSAISVDISWIDPAFGLFVIGDRTGAAIETFDAKRYTFIKAAGQGAFVGPGPTGAAGPNGVTVVGPNEVAGGDGDSTLKVVNLDTGEIQSVDTGGTHRVDEMAYDPVSDILVVANDREGEAGNYTGNFITIIKVHPLSILGKIPCPQCTTGIEQPLVVNGRFYVALPTTTANPGGEIVLVNTTTMKIDQVIKTSDCKPTGLAAGIGGLFVAGGGGCVIDPRSGTGTPITDAGGDEIATLPGRGIYAFVIAGTQTLNLVDAGTNEVYQKLPIALGHNLAANPENGEIWIPDYQTKSVLVFAPVTSLGGGTK